MLLRSQRATPRKRHALRPMYTPSHIANFMLDRAEEDARGLSPMKLLKLVYIGYGWSLAVFG